MLHIGSRQAYTIHFEGACKPRLYNRLSVLLWPVATCILILFGHIMPTSGLESTETEWLRLFRFPGPPLCIVV